MRKRHKGAGGAKGRMWDVKRGDKWGEGRTQKGIKAGLQGWEEEGNAERCRVPQAAASTTGTTRGRQSRRCTRPWSWTGPSGWPRASRPPRTRSVSSPPTTRTCSPSEATPPAGTPSLVSPARPRCWGQLGDTPGIDQGQLRDTPETAGGQPGDILGTPQGHPGDSSGTPQGQPGGTWGQLGDTPGTTQGHLGDSSGTSWGQLWETPGTAQGQPRYSWGDTLGTA